MNSVNLIGHLATDPTAREAGEHTVASFRLAIPRRRVRGEDRGAVFVTVEAWNGTAKIVLDHMAKGRRVGVSGRLELNEWTDENGERHSRTFIVAEEVTFASDAPTSDQDE